MEAGAAADRTVQSDSDSGTPSAAKLHPAYVEPGKKPHKKKAKKTSPKQQFYKKNVVREVTEDTEDGPKTKKKRFNVKVPVSKYRLIEAKKDFKQAVTGKATWAAALLFAGSYVGSQFHEYAERLGVEGAADLMFWTGAVAGLYTAWKTVGGIKNLIPLKVFGVDEKSGEANKFLNEHLIKPVLIGSITVLVNMGVLPTTKYATELANGNMTYADAVDQWSEDQVDWVRSGPDFTEQKIAENRANYFAENGLIRSAYAYFDVTTGAYNDDPNAAALYSFALSDYVSRAENPDQWMRTQMAMIAYYTTGIDPRYMAVLADREANGNDVVADNSSGRGYYQYLDLPWVRSIISDREQMIEILRSNPELAEEGRYADIIERLETLGQPAFGNETAPVLVDTRDPTYRWLQRNRTDAQLADMTLIEYYEQRIILTQEGRISGEHHDDMFVQMMDWRMDMVIAPIKTALDRLDESDNRLLFENTKDMTQQAFHVLVADDYSKHHMGLTRYSTMRRMLRTQEGRLTVAATTPGFRDAAYRNPYDFYADGANRRNGFTFADLEGKYMESVSEYVSTHFARTSSEYQEIQLRELLIVPEEFNNTPEEAEAWKDRILRDDSIFYPNRGGYILARASDALPEDLIYSVTDGYLNIVDTFTFNSNPEKLPAQIAEVNVEPADVQTVADYTTQVAESGDSVAFVSYLAENGVSAEFAQDFVNNYRSNPDFAHAQLGFSVQNDPSASIDTIAFARDVLEWHASLDGVTLSSGELGRARNLERRLPSADYSVERVSYSSSVNRGANGPS